MNNPTDELDPIAKGILHDLGSESITGERREREIKERLGECERQRPQQKTTMFVFIIVSEALTDPLVKQYIQQGINKVNEEAISRAARIQVSL